MSGKAEAKRLQAERIEETADALSRPTPPPDLFAKTERPPVAAPEGQAAEPEERPPVAPARKSRRWDKDPANRLYSYRLGADLDGLLTEAVDQYRRAGWHTTKAEVLRAWALAGFEAWQTGQIEVGGYPLAERGGKRKSPRAGL